MKKNSKPKFLDLGYKSLGLCQTKKSRTVLKHSY